MGTPFLDKEFTFTNPDGSTIRVRGSGNQYYAVFETLDGYTVVKDPDTGFYKYATLSGDKNQLVPTGPNVGDVDPQSLGLQRHVRIRQEAAREEALRSPLQQGERRRWETRRDQEKAQPRAGGPDAEKGDEGT